MNLSLGIALGLISMFSFGIAHSLSKIPAKNLGANRLLFWRNVFNVIFLAIIFLLFRSNENFDLKYIVFAAILSVLGYIPIFFFYKAMETGKVGLISPVASSHTILAIALAITFYRERLSSTHLVSISLIVLGVLLISLNLKDIKHSDIFKRKSGLPYAFITAVTWGFYFFLIKIPVDKIGPVLTSLITESGMLICAFLVLISKRDQIVYKTKKHIFTVIIISVLATIGFLAYLQGMNIGGVSIVTALSASSPLVIVLYGRLIYKEVLKPLQYCAIALILIGILALSLT